MSDNGATGVHQFKLLDVKGVSHDYVVTEHPAGEGMAIMYDLLGLGAPTVLGLAGAAMKSEELVRAVLGALGEGAESVGYGDLGRMAAGLDLERVGAELGRALGDGRAPKLTLAVLAKTYRNGRQLVVGGRASGDFELAFQANYAELLQAVWKVAQINRFFPVPSTSPSSLLGLSSGTPHPPPVA